MAGRRRIHLTDSQKTKSIKAIKLAIDVIGTQKVLARLLDRTPQVINTWANGLQIIPIEHANKLDKIFRDLHKIKFHPKANMIKKKDLRPDLFS